MNNKYLDLKLHPKMGKGLYAKVDIPANTQLLSVREDKFIIYTQLCEHHLFQKIKQQTKSKIGQFAFFLAFCQLTPNNSKQEEQVKQYLKQLPLYYHNLICWEEEELSMINNDTLVQKIKKRKSQLLDIYTKIAKFQFQEKEQQKIEVRIEESIGRRGNRIRHEETKRYKKVQQTSKLQIIKRVTFKDMLRYVATIQSRNAYYQNQDDINSELGALIPYIQLFNHNKDTQCEVERGSENYLIITNRQIKRGQQVYVNYGSNYSSEQFLEFYGMLPEDQVLENGQLFEKQNQNFEDQDQIDSQSIKSKIRSQRMKLARKYNAMRNSQPNKTMKPPLRQKN